MDAIERIVPKSMPETEADVRAVLAEQGFGVLTEIDVANTLKAKIDVDWPGCKILGACNPAFAHRALQIDSMVATLLPCNVVLEDVGDGTRVRFVDPVALMDDARFAGLAEEVGTRLRAAADALPA